MKTEQNTTPENLLKALRWRYAVQKFDPIKKISDELWKTLEESLVLAPSSFGLQPWKFFVVTNQSVKDRMVAASWNQRQVADASHVVVLAARKGIDLEHVERFLQRVADVRAVSLESLAGLRKVMSKFVQNPPPQFDLNVWAAKQVYIALGQFMVSAAMLGVDTCPMEGFDPVKIDEILGLSALGYTAAAMAPAGYRAIDDARAAHPKVRFQSEHVITRIP